METTRNQLPPYPVYFFNKLGNYLDTKLYYFGSVQRRDYFPESSDVDVAIFTDNVQGTITKMQSILNVNKKDFKKFVWKLNSSDIMANGHKLLYKEPDNNFVAEFSIYDDKFKDKILFEYHDKQELPYYATVLLIIAKYLYYSFALIPGYWYTAMKKFILSYLIGRKEDHFVIID